jgi:hypothetical protein
VPTKNRDETVRELPWTLAADNNLRAGCHVGSEGNPFQRLRFETVCPSRPEKNAFLAVIGCGGAQSCRLTSSRQPFRSVSGQFGRRAVEVSSHAGAECASYPEEEPEEGAPHRDLRDLRSPKVQTRAADEASEAEVAMTTTTTMVLLRCQVMATFVVQRLPICIRSFARESLREMTRLLLRSEYRSQLPALRRSPCDVPRRAYEGTRQGEGW